LVNDHSAIIFSQLLETEFFPKWLDVLHIWLIQPQVSRSCPVVFVLEGNPLRDRAEHARRITRGLQLMNKAIELGPEAPVHLTRPDFRAELLAEGSAGQGQRNGSSGKPARTMEVTFRSIVEEFAASHNSLIMHTGKAHEVSRMPLFRVSPTVDGKGGLLVYILDDAVWAPAAR
jgi:tuftelin-interacting protein 11